MSQNAILQVHFQPLPSHTCTLCIRATDGTLSQRLQSNEQELAQTKLKPSWLTDLFWGQLWNQSDRQVSWWQLQLKPERALVQFLSKAQPQPCLGCATLRVGAWGTW